MDSVTFRVDLRTGQGVYYTSRLVAWLALIYILSSSQ